MSAFVVALTGGLPALAAPPDPVEDGHGREWRQLYETTGLTWNQVAQICPRDGVTPCSGAIGPIVFSNWVWGTAGQVRELMSNYTPAILTANPGLVWGPDFFFPAAVFFNDMRITNFVSGCEVCFSQSATGWTSSDEGGTPVAGGVAMSYPPPNGAFFVLAGNAVDQVVPARGIWPWSPVGTDHSPPLITPSVTGTLGSNGWYVSNITVSWVVQDAESAISATVGCDPVSVSGDTTGTTFTCQATSAGGTSSASVVVKRDVTAPTVTCPSPAPVF